MLTHKARFHLIRRGFNILRLQPLEGGDVDVCDEGVQLVHGVLILITKSSKSNADTERNVPGIQTSRISTPALL